MTAIPEDAIDDFNEAGEAWARYLKTDPEKPNPSAAQLASQALLYAAATATAAQFEDNIKAAAAAQAVYAEAEPSASSYLELTRLRYYAGDNAGAEEAARHAEQEAPEAQRSRPSTS